MSHVSAIETVINDLDCLELAAKACGMELIRGATSFKWYGRWVADYHGDDAAYKHGVKPEDYGKCQHVLRIQGDDKAYEIGVLENPDGTFRLIYDHWGEGQKLVKACGGKDLPKLTQAYIKNRAVRELEKRGFKVLKEENLASGSLKLTLQGKVKL